MEGIASPRLSVLVQVGQHYLVPTGRSGAWVRLSQRFRHDGSEPGQLFEMCLRSTASGSVSFRRPRLTRVSPSKGRKIRVATARFDEVEPITLQQQRQRITDILDQAGGHKPDIVVLPEYSPVVGVPESSFGLHYTVAEPVPTGPVCSILSAKAARYSMYVIAGVLENRDGYLYNTAVIFDRGGRLVGQYDKTHPTMGEMYSGFSCGASYPVFDLDFGRIGIHICYDEWFPEVSRLFACKGAEILFLPGGWREAHHLADPGHGQQPLLRELFHHPAEHDHRFFGAHHRGDPWRRRGVRRPRPGPPGGQLLSGSHGLFRHAVPVAGDAKRPGRPPDGGAHPTVRGVP